MKNQGSLKTWVVFSSAALIVSLLNGCDKAPETVQAPATSEQAATVEAAAEKREKVQLVHVHGLSYSPDGTKLLIPSHHGLAVFTGSGWSKAAGPQHDYMGFSATKEAIYSSGHPAPDAGLVNPFGVIKSTDGGQTWQKLGLEGESDFHLLATGYETNTIFVVNYQKNSKMKEAGIHYTVNDGFSWERAKAQGLEGNIASLAVHPTNSRWVAAGTVTGAFLSEDAGDTFRKIGDGEVVAVFFDLNEKQLWFSTATQGQPALSRLDLDSKQAESINLPPLPKDAVAYIAQNPAKRDEYAVATYQRSVYLSQDNGKTWKQIADNGETQ